MLSAQAYIYMQHSDLKPAQCIAKLEHCLRWSPLQQFHTIELDTQARTHTRAPTHRLALAHTYIHTYIPYLSNNTPHNYRVLPCGVVRDWYEIKLFGSLQVTSDERPPGLLPAQQQRQQQQVERAERQEQEAAMKRPPRRPKKNLGFGGISCNACARRAD